jgi:hypothetical protein
MKVTWRKLLKNRMLSLGESWEDVVSTTLTDEQADKEFSDDYGGKEGDPFTVWTRERVYFPGIYDGAEWVASVPRNPCDEATDHVGGY